MPQQLTPEDIAAELHAHPGLDKYSLLAALGPSADGLTTHDLNVMLYRYPDSFEWRPGAGAARLWYAVGPESSALTTGSPAPRPAVEEALAAPPQPADPLQLYPWQRRALDVWRAQGCVGVVEAVTGAGKTRVALKAIADEFQAGGKCLVLVPTIELMTQWEREIYRQLVLKLGLWLRIGCLGGDRWDNLQLCDVLVATVSSAVQTEIGVGRRGGLLVADEVHHCGAEVWSRALKPRFHRRLGLTATYERDDLGIDEYLDPYFRGVCYSLDYDEALEDGVIAHFRVGFVGVDFSESETAQYEEASRRLREHRRKLVYEYGLPGEPFGVFIREVQKLRARAEPHWSKMAGYYLSDFTKRRGLMASSRQKLELLPGLAPAVRDAERTILFSQTKAAADDAVAALRRLGIQGRVMDATMDIDDRRGVFADSESGENELLAAPKLLDEGVDVPSADLAIILSTSRSRRQLIQRMGRVVRKKPDGREARVAIMYVANTIEDPALGAHEDFLEEIEEAATEVRAFPPGTLPEVINAWLRPEGVQTSEPDEPDGCIKVEDPQSRRVLERQIGLLMVEDRAHGQARFVVSAPNGSIVVWFVPSGRMLHLTVLAGSRGSESEAGRELLRRIGIRLNPSGTTSFHRETRCDDLESLHRAARLLQVLIRDVLGGAEGFYLHADRQGRELGASPHSSGIQC